MAKKKKKGRNKKNNPKNGRSMGIGLTFEQIKFELSRSIDMWIFFPHYICTAILHKLWPGESMVWDRRCGELTLKLFPGFPLHGGSGKQHSVNSKEVGGKEQRTDKMNRKQLGR